MTDMKTMRTSTGSGGVHYKAWVAWYKNERKKEKKKLTFFTIGNSINDLFDWFFAKFKFLIKVNQMIKVAGSWDKNTDTGNLILQTPMFEQTFGMREN